MVEMSKQNGKQKTKPEKVKLFSGTPLMCTINDTTYTATTATTTTTTRTNTHIFKLLLPLPLLYTTTTRLLLNYYLHFN